MYFSELKNYVVLVKGIPENIPPEQGSIEIKRILSRTYLNQLVDFKIVGEYKEVYKLALEWKTLCEQLKLSKKKEKFLKMYEKEQKKTTT